jgi:hypothetical protein
LTDGQECAVARRPPRSWDEAAERLGVELLRPGEHSARWRSSLRPGSDFFRGLAEGVPAGDLGHVALDAAAGLSVELELLQRSCFGPAWEARRRQFFLMCRTLGLSLLPPPGIPQDAWRAIRAVAEGGYESWNTVQRELPDEHTLLTRYEQKDPEGYERLFRMALEAAVALDGQARPRVEEAKRDLDSSTAFRTVWRRVFGAGAGIQPRAARNLAVLVLQTAKTDVRATGLFVAWLGLTQTAFRPGLTSEAREAGLILLDGEVHNTRKTWRRLGHGGLAAGPSWDESAPRQLVRIVEWITAERLDDPGAMGVVSDP